VISISKTLCSDQFFFGTDRSDLLSDCCKISYYL